ncbi:MAG: protein kinase [Lentisphaeraceae bacterium]|nr:protein kinase [Lentisphaeraceae bacterium]
MSLKTVKVTEDCKISFLQTDGKTDKVQKEFYNKEFLENELYFTSILDCALKPELKDSTLVYPYLPPLSEYIQNPLPEPEAVELMEKCLVILEELKSKKIVHRDIKPGNLYLDSDNCLFLSDFESAQIEDKEDISKTCGTPGYMAPEQYQTPNVDWLADQYAFGAVFYKMLTGSEAFEEKDRNFEYQSQNTPDPSIKNPKLKAPFCRIVTKTMSPNKEERFQSIEQIRDALAECKKSLQAVTVLEDKTVKIVPKTKAKKKSKLVRFIILFFALVLGAVLLKSL